MKPFQMVSQEPFRALVEASPDAILALDSAGSVVFANPAAERLLGYTAAELLDRRVAHFLPADPVVVPRDAPELPVRTRTGREVHLEVATATLQQDGEPVTVLFLRDLSRHRDAERRLRTQHALTRVLAESPTWEAAVAPFLRILCEGTGWEVGILWEAEPDAPVLCFSGAWHAPEVPAGPLVTMSRQLAFLPGVGLPGRVWETRAPVWAPDLDSQGRLLRTPHTADGGLRRAFAFPVLLGGEVLGVVELFSASAAEPDAATREMLEAVASELGQFARRKRAEADAAAREERFRSLIEYATDVITVLDARGKVRYESSALERVLGYRPEELVGEDVFSLIHPDDLRRVRKAFALALRNPGVAITLEYRFRHRDGSWRAMESVGRNLLHAPSVAGVVVNSRDVSVRRKAEDEVRRQSLTDELTGLYNRRGFFALAEQQLRAAQRTGVKTVLMYLDVDGLKDVNDRLGHAEGDRVLVATAGLLAPAFRHSDVVARLGGDEFVVLAPDVSREQAEGMVERLHRRVRTWNAGRPGELPLSLSVGLAWYDAEHLPTVDALLAAADAAMYSRKRGKGGAAG